MGSQSAQSNGSSETDYAKPEEACNGHGVSGGTGGLASRVGGGGMRGWLASGTARQLCP